MIVGEAPGKQEIEQGEPFIGQAGKMLDGALRALGVRREEVYITNVVKDWPRDSDGKTRRPYDEEIEAWRPMLDNEILQVAPAAILLLGRTAIDTLITDAEVIGFGSKVQEFYTAWHPAYVLRNRSLMEEWLEQIRPWSEALGKFEYPS